MSAIRDFTKYAKTITPASSAAGDVVPLDAAAPKPGDKKAPPAATKTYVNISTIGVGETFDDKYKATLPAIMNSSLADGVNGSSKLTTDDAPKGFYLGGSLTLKRTDTGISAVLTMQLGDWPSQSMWGFATPKGATEVRRPAKIDDDVDFLVKAVLAKALTTVLPQFESRVP
jgi:hypothetical protein